MTTAQPTSHSPGSSVPAAVFTTRALEAVRHLQQHYAQLPVSLQSQLQPQLSILAGVEYKLSQSLLQIAVFGWVGRGKSAVLNGLLGQPVFPVGPLHGVTQWPRAVRWMLPLEAVGDQATSMAVELVDTPGLDEVAGQSRTQMALEIAQQADLILFVVEGKPTAAELEALGDLQQARKPLLLVINKMDLQPHLNLAEVYQSLPPGLQAQGLVLEDVVATAAAPAPVKVWEEWPDGRRTETWEAPPVQIEALQTRLTQILTQEGQSLLTVHGLLQVEGTGQAIAAHMMAAAAPGASQAYQRYRLFKALGVAFSPWWGLDLGMGILLDLVGVRSQARHFYLPFTQAGISQLSSALLWSAGLLCLGEIGGALLSGLEAVSWGSPLGPLPWVGGAMVQGALAAYGSARVEQVAQQYLLAGSTWGPLGASTLLQQQLSQLAPDTLVRRWHGDPDGLSQPQSKTALTTSATSWQAATNPADRDGYRAE